jgi:hypothetical protein
MYASKKITVLFSGTKTREETLQLFKSSLCGICIYLLVGSITPIYDLLTNSPMNVLYKGASGAFIAVCWSVLAALIFVAYKFESRTAAIILFLYFGFLATTITYIGFVLIFSGLVMSPLSSIVVHVLSAWCSLRAVEATFKLHGRFGLSQSVIGLKV